MMYIACKGGAQVINDMLDSDVDLLSALLRAARQAA